ncbi:hypothetical protein M0R45_021861 [Rubus argutus]|uniref:Uncharacterized protein n=1 Tax=Rubus argutus TaxID=59490 RepID=A0AAW1XG53_RUBAR
MALVLLDNGLEYVDLVQLAARVGNPLGGSTLSRVSTTGCCTSCTGVVHLDSPIGDGGVFVCGVLLQLGFVGFVGGGTDSGGFAEGAPTFGGIVRWLDDDDDVGGLASYLEADGGAGGLVSYLEAISVFGWVLL